MNYLSHFEENDCSAQALHADNVRAFGLFDAVVILKKRGIPFEQAYFLTFGKQP